MTDTATEAIVALQQASSARKRAEDDMQTASVYLDDCEQRLHECQIDEEAAKARLFALATGNG